MHVTCVPQYLRYTHGPEAARNDKHGRVERHGLVRNPGGDATASRPQACFHMYVESGTNVVVPALLVHGVTW